MRWFATVLIGLPWGLAAGAGGCGSDDQAFSSSAATSSGVASVGSSGTGAGSAGGATGQGGAGLGSTGPGSTGQGGVGQGGAAQGGTAQGGGPSSGAGGSSPLCVPEAADGQCLACAKTMCCDETVACAGDAVCVCLLQCIDNGTSPNACFGSCGFSNLALGIATCVQASCSNACG
jgi:hypothetical protein